MTSKKQKLQFRTAYNLGNENYSEKHSDDGLTEQHHADSCDINKILAQFNETGILQTSTNNDPQYGDVSEHDFQEVQNQLANAKSLFKNCQTMSRHNSKTNPSNSYTSQKTQKIWTH